MPHSAVIGLYFPSSLSFPNHLIMSTLFAIITGSFIQILRLIQYASAWGCVCLHYKWSREHHGHWSGDAAGVTQSAEYNFRRDK